MMKGTANKGPSSRSIAYLSYVNAFWTDDVNFKVRTRRIITILRLFLVSIPMYGPVYGSIHSSDSAYPRSQARQTSRWDAMPSPTRNANPNPNANANPNPNPAGTASKASPGLRRPASEGNRLSEAREYRRADPRSGPGREYFRVSGPLASPGTTTSMVDEDED